MPLVKDIRDLSPEQLRQQLDDLRLKRKKGFERKPRKKTIDANLKNLPEELQQKLLQLLEGAEET